MRHLVHFSDFVAERWCVVETANRTVRWVSRTRRGCRAWATAATCYSDKRGRFAVRRCWVDVAVAPSR